MFSFIWRQVLIWSVFEETHLSPAISHLTVMIRENTMGFKEALSWVHSNIVSGTLRDRRANVVLNGHPPLISVTEKLLPRPTRVTLAQLRSGYSKYLNSYMARVNPDVCEICPLCCSSTHTTRHFFEWAQRSTSLTPLRLWTDPVDAGRFLEMDLVQ